MPYERLLFNILQTQSILALNNSPLFIIFSKSQTMRYLLNSFSLVLIFILSFQSIEAQRKYRKTVKQRFSAGLIGGVSFSQLDGDSHTGYDHKNVFGGLKVSARLNYHLSFDVNLIYIRKGATIESEPFEFRVSYPKDRFIHLEYAEVPFLLNYKPNGLDSKFYMESGFSIARLMNTSIVENLNEFTNISYQELVPEFNSTDFSYIAGMGTELINNLSLGIRFSYGLNKIYNNENPEVKEFLFDPEPVQIFYLRNYLISVNFTYNIF